MIKKISLPILTSLMLLPALSFAAQDSLSESLLTAFGTGVVSGEVGVNFRVKQAETNSNDGNIGYGYLDLSYVTNEYKGARVGATVLGVAKLFDGDSYGDAFSNNGSFQDEVMLRDIYLDYDLPGINSQLLIGRAPFEGTPVTDGDVHQGLQLSYQHFDNISFYASVMNGWVDNASTAFDLDGIDATWLDGDDAVNGAPDSVFSFIADMTLVPEKFNLAYFLIFQEDVVTTYGAFGDLVMPLQDNLNAGLDGTYALYDENTDTNTDTFAYSYNLHASLSAENWSFGIGYYMMSDDARVSALAIGNDIFDPMEEGVYGGSRDDNTRYIDAEYTRGPMTVAAVWGDTEVDRTGEGATEFDFYLTYALSDSINTEFMFVDVNDNDSSLDYQVYAGTVNLSF